MSTTYCSPYASSFKSALKRGTSYNQVVWNIANRNKKSVDHVWNSLFKAGLCWRQKFNGQWCYFPCDVYKCNTTTVKHCQHNMWQWFCEWCLENGHCTPQQLKNHCGSQSEFMTWCRKYWNKQYNADTCNKSYKFPVTKTTTTHRRYRKAA